MSVAIWAVHVVAVQARVGFVMARKQDSQRINDHRLADIVGAYNDVQAGLEFQFDLSGIA